MENDGFHSQVGKDQQKKRKTVAGATWLGLFSVLLLDVSIDSSCQIEKVIQGLGKITSA